MRRPITDVPFSEVLTRVSFRVIELHWRRTRRSDWSYPAARVYDLAQELREQRLVNVYWTLSQCARWLASGYTLRAWRDELRPDQQMRAAHKQRPRGTR